MTVLDSALLICENKVVQSEKRRKEKRDISF